MPGSAVPVQVLPVAVRWGCGFMLFAALICPLSFDKQGLLCLQGNPSGLSFRQSGNLVQIATEG